MERGIGVAGLAVGFVAGVLSALVEAFLIPLRVGSIPIPVAPFLALGLGYPLCRLTRYLGGSRVAALAPAAGWFLVVAVLGSVRPGGDIALANNLMTLATVFLGATSFAVGLFLAVSPSRDATLSPSRGARR